MPYKAFDLSGKVALITGGNAGIGLGMADAVAQAGGDVCIWGTNAAKNNAALEQLNTHRVRASALVCDVADEASVEHAFAETLAQFGRVDGCFANAGVLATPTPFTKLSSADWRRVMAVNLDGCFYTLRAAARHMVERADQGDSGGRLIATASIAAIAGAARNEHYAATKGALISLVRALAVELAHHGITANAILPGWIETAMTASTFASEKFSRAVKPRVPMGRWGCAEDLGAIAIYLMSDASGYHTGDCIRIDGGYFLF